MGASSRQQHPELIQISTAARSDTNVQTLELQSVEPTHAYRLAPRSRAKLATGRAATRAMPPLLRVERKLQLVRLKRDQTPTV